MQRQYTTHDVAKLIQVDPSTVSKWVDKGLLLAFRTPGGHRRVRADDLRSFLSAYKMPIPEELGGARKKILVVDDDKRVLESIKRSFKPQTNVEVDTTTSGVDALLRVTEERPDALLIDLNLPDLNGLEVCKRVRARKQLQGMQIIAFTGSWSPEIEKQALTAGATMCLPKPLDVERALAALNANTIRA